MNKLLFYTLVFCLVLCYGCKPSKSLRVAETKAVDKVTPELAKAVSKYDKVFNFHDGLAPVQKDGKYGYINKLGEEIIPCKYDKAEEFYNGLAVVAKKISEDEYRYGCINIDDEMVIPQKYDYIQGFKLNQVTPARLNDKEGAINMNGEIVVPFEYKLVSVYSEDMAYVQNDNNKVGFVNIKGDLVIPLMYNEYSDSYFSEGLACVKNNEGKCGFIDKTGQVVIPFVYDWAKPFHCGYAAVGFDSNIEMIGGTPSFTYKNSYINKIGDVVMKPIIDGSCNNFSESGFAEVHLNHKGYGIVDRHFNLVLPCEYYIVYCSGFATDELIPVAYEKKQYGVFDAHNRKFVVQCEYEGLGYAYSEGYISAMKNEKLGYLDKYGNVVIPFCYDSASDFSEGFAVVERYGKYGYVDRYGNDTFSVL